MLQNLTSPQQYEMIMLSFNVVLKGSLQIFFKLSPYIFIAVHEQYIYKFVAIPTLGS